jgi:phosphoribosylanthranilate isomerase
LKEFETEQDRFSAGRKPLRIFLKMIIQIYEIQTAVEALTMIELGVDHVGSVILSEAEWKNPAIRDTLACVRSSAARSSLIPLFNTPESVCRILDYYRPDIIHFCEALTDQPDVKIYCQKLIELQQEVKARFPDIKIMRSIPIARNGNGHSILPLEIATWFEPFSDFFLTDTILEDPWGTGVDKQPVKGFVGITGRTCDWETAGRLAASSRIPVILAGGISPANVSEGIRRVRPAGVDSCTLTNARDNSGLPIRFKKDTQKVKQLIDAVREAEKELKGSKVQDSKVQGSEVQGSGVPGS